VIPQSVSVILREDFPIMAKHASPRLGSALGILPLMLYPSLADVWLLLHGSCIPAVSVILSLKRK
jgi:hypothetical protein